MKNIEFLSDNFHFLLVKCSVYLNRLVFVMSKSTFDIFSLHCLLYNKYIFLSICTHMLLF